MSKVKNIAEGVVVFMGGVLFAYWTYPFVNSLLNTITATTGIFEGWTNIRYIMWAGYFTIILLVILVWPAYKIFIQEVEIQQ